MHVAIVGAGAAGLTAARDLSRAGVGVTVLEARDRLGGRIWSTPGLRPGLPTELGAEFIHGRPREIDALVEEGDLRVRPVDAPAISSRRGKLEDGEVFSSSVGELISQIGLSGLDLSFDELARERGLGGESLRRTRAFVEGFHAAPADDVSAHALRRSQEAEAVQHGDEARIFLDGASSVVRTLFEGIDLGHARLYLRHPVRRIHWQLGHVSLYTDGHEAHIQADAAIITLPASLLRLEQPSFHPRLYAKLAALEHMGMGRVERLTLHLSQPIWEASRDAALRGRWGFLFTDEEIFPTLWRRADSDTIVAWAGAHHAERVPAEAEARHALLVGVLARQLRLPRELVRESLLRSDRHDWWNDPYARGAYSYYRVGGEEASRTLASPLADTLFFAGEATDVDFHNGTMHGAIASGHRAARQVLTLLGARPSAGA